MPVITFVLILVAALCTFVIAAATRNITVRKQGFERIVATFSQNWPISYGLLAVLLSVGFGWAAGALFRRI